MAAYSYNNELRDLSIRNLERSRRGSIVFSHPLWRAHCQRRGLAVCADRASFNTGQPMLVQTVQKFHVHQGGLEASGILKTCRIMSAVSKDCGRYPLHRPEMSRRCFPNYFFQVDRQVSVYRFTWYRNCLMYTQARL